MKLLGAKEFIKMPVGTFYIPYWRNTKNECLKIIEKFKEDAKGFLNTDLGDLHVFGDNSGSMSFSGYEEENYIFYYDANVVGDASPTTTLYLVIEEKDLPNIIQVYDSERNLVKLSKDDIIRIKNIFVNEVYEESKTDLWAIKELDRLAKEYGNIVETNINAEV